MKLSLVVATVNRTAELRVLLQSFAQQSFRNFEVIVVDQNDDDRLRPLVAEFQQLFQLTHLRSAQRNSSHARNLGLAEACGDIIGFPDDDCVYRSDTILRVMQRFGRNAGLGFLTGVCVNAEGRPINGRWLPSSANITPANVWTTLQAFTLWIRLAPARKAGGFDMNIGPGTQWGSSEEPDLALRLLRAGAQGYYDVEIGVLHPDNSMQPNAIARAFLYGAGMGRVLRKHALSPLIVLPFFIRPAGGFLLSVGRLRPQACRYYWGTLRGRLFGYLAKPQAR